MYSRIISNIKVKSLDCGLVTVILSRSLNTYFYRFNIINKFIYIYYSSSFNTLILSNLRNMKYVKCIIEVQYKINIFYSIN